jgi:threonine synthase
VRAFAAGEEKATPWKDARTFALGLRVPAAVADFWMLRALRESHGTAIAVGEDEIARAGRELAEQEGVFACPEGAAAWAALSRSESAAALGDAETVVLFNTGGWYKYAEGWHRVLGL